MASSQRPPATMIAATGGPAALVEQLRGAGLTRDVQVLGGSRTIQALLDIGAIDRLGLCVLPVLLGTGIPIFKIEPVACSNEAWEAAQASPSEAAPHARLRLDGHRTFPDGTVELVYQQAG